jgi:large subunit ribosomal protein L10
MRAEKQLLLDEVKEKIQKSKGFVIARYQGMTADKARKFRDSVANAKGDFEVVRKRVFMKAAESSGYKLPEANYEGHLGILFAEEDALTISKIAVKYGDDNDKGMEIVCGLIDGTICSGAEVVALTKLPSLNEMRSQILGILQAPMSNAVGVIQSALTSVIYCVDEKRKQGDKE